MVAFGTRLGFRAVVCFASLLGAAAVLLLSSGPVLIEMGLSDEAGDLPGSASLAANYRFARLHDQNERRAELALAKKALRESPLQASALSVLAVAQAAEPDPRLIQLTNRLGWRDGFTQSNLYNTALRTGAPSEALRHLIAMIKQQMFGPDLEQKLVVGAEIPAFRQAMLPYFASVETWPDRWLATYGISLSDAALLDLAKARASAQGTLSHPLAASLSQQLQAASRLTTAMRITRLAGVPTNSEGVLPWPQPEGINSPTPFEWQLGQGHAIAAQPVATLVAQGTLPVYFSFRMLNLSAGQYVLKADSSPEARDNWRWDIGCGRNPVGATRRLAPINRIAVARNCPLQWLSLSSAMPQSSAQGLRAVSIEKLP